MYTHAESNGRWFTRESKVSHFMSTTDRLGDRPPGVQRFYQPDTSASRMLRKFVAIRASSGCVAMFTYSPYVHVMSRVGLASHA